MAVTFQGDFEEVDDIEAFSFRSMMGLTKEIPCDDVNFKLDVNSLVVFDQLIYF